MIYMYSPLLHNGRAVGGVRDDNAGWRGDWCAWRSSSPAQLQNSGENGSIPLLPLRLSSASETSQPQHRIRAVHDLRKHVEPSVA